MSFSGKGIINNGDDLQQATTVCARTADALDKTGLELLRITDAQQTLYVRLANGDWTLLLVLELKNLYTVDLQPRATRVGLTITLKRYCS